MDTIKLDSDVDVRCDFCARTGRRGYMTSDTTGLEVFCPACFVFLYGLDGHGLKESWDEKKVVWKHYGFTAPADQIE